ncbi:MAG TPA: SDR family oxidoreductase [Nitrososphaera sp.]|nr:SDR family oxidoreductase [Nitrososphaera sp.]
MKSIIVTGASSGIGRAATVKLSKSGYTVFGLARSYDKLTEMSAALPKDRYFPIKFDITKPETLEKVVNDISAKGPIFGLVNNAGYVEPGAFEDICMEDLRIQFETNFFGIVGLTKQVLPGMLQRREGRIVNVSSMAGLVSLPLIGAYCATKHALEAFSEALRMELWNTGIKVVNINPGVIETNIHTITNAKIARLKDSRFKEAYRKYLQRIPEGMPASAVADVIVKSIVLTKPKPRYLIGSWKEKVGVTLRPYIPDEVFHSQVAKRVLT